MSNINASAEQFAQVGQQALDNAARLSNLSLAAAERLVKLNLSVAKNTLDESVESARSLLAVKDAQGLNTLASGLGQPGLDKAAAVARSYYDALVDIQSELNAFAEEQYGAANKAVLANLDQALKSAPAGSDVAVAALKQAMTAASTAYETVSKTAKKVTTELAEAGVAATSTKKAAK